MVMVIGCSSSSRPWLELKTENGSEWDLSNCLLYGYIFPIDQVLRSACLSVNQRMPCEHTCELWCAQPLLHCVQRGLRNRHPYIVAVVPLRNQPASHQSERWRFIMQIMLLQICTDADQWWGWMCFASDFPLFLCLCVCGKFYAHTEDDDDDDNCWLHWSYAP